MKTEFFDAVAHLVSVDSQELSRLRLIPVRALECLQEELPLDVFEVQPLGWQLERSCRDRAGKSREVVGVEPLPFVEEHGPLDRVLQLTNVARPLVLLEKLHRLGRQPANLLPEFTVVAIDVIGRQQRYVATPFAQRRQEYWHHLEPIKEVFA